MAADHGVSPPGINFIISFEGMRSEMYDDNAGHCTIGIGHLIHQGSCVHPIYVKNGSQAQLSSQQRKYLALEAPFYQPLSQPAATNLFRMDVAKAEDVVNSLVAVALNQPQFDALVSFAFNVGTFGFANSTLIKRLNIGRYQDVPGEMRRWVKSNSNGVQTVNAVLVARRAREAGLFENGRY